MSPNRLIGIIKSRLQGFNCSSGSCFFLCWLH